MADTPAPAKRVFRVAAVSRPHPTGDTFSNLTARLGVGPEQSNIQAGSTYTANPITRNRTLLEFAYRGSWIVGQVVDAVAEDMTRAGVRIASTMPPEDIAQMHRGAQRLGIWDSFESGLKWSRLYGGAILVLLVEGQDPASPLDPATVRLGQFKGLLPLDRWMVQPTFTQTVTDLGPDLGKPLWYAVTANAPAFQGQVIHHTRAIRLDGIELPFWQSQQENFWGMSVVERLYDRLLAFDSTTAGTAQLVHKSYLRAYKVRKLRDILAGPDQAMKGLMLQIDTIRRFQSAEGLTLMDADDEMETFQYSFAGLSDVLARFAEQLSGATGIPLVRLFGQSPAGFSTGEADLRNYYDLINAQQNSRLRRPVYRVLDLLSASELGKAVPKGFGFDFEALWQLSAKEKADIAQVNTTTILAARDDDTISRATALKELRQQSERTGVWSNITDKDIADAEAEDAAPPPPPLPEQTDDAGEGDGRPVPDPANDVSRLPAAAE